MRGWTEILSESQLIITTDQVVLVRDRWLDNNDQVNVKKKEKKKKRKEKISLSYNCQFFFTIPRPHCSLPSFLLFFLFLCCGCGDELWQCVPVCPSNYIWSPDGGGQPVWTCKWVSLWRNITVTIYSPGVLLAFTNNFTNSGSSLEIIFPTTNFRENISYVLILNLNLDPTYSIDKCIHSIHIYWCQIIFSRKTFFILLQWFPSQERKEIQNLRLN